MDELRQEEEETDVLLAAPDKETVEMSGPELLALQQEEMFMHDGIPEHDTDPDVVAANTETVKMEPASSGEGPREAGGQIIMELIKTLREPD